VGIRQKSVLSNGLFIEGSIDQGFILRSRLVAASKVLTSIIGGGKNFIRRSNDIATSFFFLFVFHVLLQASPKLSNFLLVRILVPTPSLGTIKGPIAK
jgi:hypothetical protein